MEKELDVNGIVSKYPRLSFLKSAAFESLPAEKKEFLLGCVEDALFWVETEAKGEKADQSFRFLAAHYGLEKAKEEAVAKGLKGKAREDFLKPIHDLYLMYNPQSPSS